MTKSLAGSFFSLFLLLFSLSAVGAHQGANDEPLPPDQAFAFSAEATDSDTIVARWTIHEGYYLYHDKIRFDTDTAGVELGKPQIPAGKIKEDEFFGKVETHRHEVAITIPVKSGPASGDEINLIARSQGCADIGICYPPYETQAKVRLAAATGGGSQAAPSLGLDAGGDDFLPPDEAFKLTTEVADDGTILAHWKIAKEYYLYRDKFAFELKGAPEGIALGDAQLPEGDRKDDEYFGRIRVFHDEVTARLPVKGAVGGETLEVAITYQGCAEAGLCYPPETKTVTLQLPTDIVPGGVKPKAVEDLERLGGELGLDASDEFLPPDEAFQLKAEMADDGSLLARWTLAEGYYLYRDKFTFELQAAPKGVGLGEVTLPKGKVKQDPVFGKVEVFYDKVKARVPVNAAEPGQTIKVAIGYQGCADAGLCYPPQTKVVSLTIPEATAAAAATAEPTAPTTAPAGADAEPANQADRFLKLLHESSLWMVMVIALGFGVLLAFTACMYPMIPILSGIIVGQGEHLTAAKGFFLSLVYVLALGITFGVIGALIAWFAGGVGIQAYFQSPWVLIPFALLFVILALGMYGFFNIQMPAALQSRLSGVSNRQQGGTLTGVFIMGVLSALIIGPCGGPVLIAGLSYAATSPSVSHGFLALFFLGFGMGLPLLLVGLGGGKLLPKAGGWMNTVKAVAGTVLLAVALVILERMPHIFPPVLTMLLWALLLIVAGIYMRALDPVPEGASGWRRLWKGLGLAAILYGIIVMLGGLTGGSSVTDPLHGSSLVNRAAVMAPAAAPGGGTTQSPQAAPAHLEFKRIKTVEDLQRELKAASAAGKPAMLDFYADWCTYCVKFEKYVFNEPPVQQALQGVVLLQADVTANDSEDKRLMEKFNVFLPPAILFFDNTGKELRKGRVVGYMGPEEFRAHVRKTLGQ